MTTDAVRYVATINVPGYLPMSDDLAVFDDPTDAWEYLAGELERSEELAWTPENYNDPDGPHRASDTLIALQNYTETHVHPTGTVYGPSCPDCAALGDCGCHDLGLAFSVDYAEEDVS